MVRATRKKRAGEQDLYSGCRRGQDCPDDIKAKFEQDTWADRLLKWFSSFVYFGNLGISTGRGTGGPSGYVPVGSGGRGGRPAMGGQPSRPSLVVENVGPGDIPLGGTVDASAPSVITPSESTVVVEGATTTTEEIPLVPLHPDVGPLQPETNIHVVPPPEAGGPAVLDVTSNVTSTYPHDPSIIHPGHTLLSTYINPVFEDPLFPTVSLQPLDTSLIPGETSFPPHTVVNLSGTFEDIELDVLDGSSKLTDPKTSTPVSRVDSGLQSIRRAYTRRANVLRKYYNRFTQQVRVQKPEFLTQPSKLISYEFTNQAFDPDTTLQFPQPADEVVYAPDNDFQDVGTLHRPIYSLEGGHVRVSRFGVRETIRTRVGTTIGARVHFFTDVSTISNISDTFGFTSTLGPDVGDPGIELHLFGESTGDTSIADAQGGGVFLQNGTLQSETQFTDVVNGSLQSEYSDSMLLDSYSETFDTAHLALLNSNSSSQVLSIPELARPFRGPAESTGGLAVAYPVDSSLDVAAPSTPFIHNVPTPPFVVLHFSGGGTSFFLHPSLLRLRRKRVFY
ncbi:L2 [Tursiops truncatus papillomavirus 6]|uniref:Minor capsid protein L2 n=1 Tax=Tursiops truncatus papillomavirus 6 TaxID=1144382 RepID=H6UYQ0_PSPV|nr:L2 [Tursiops truncatus papillomavirus 6]